MKTTAGSLSLTRLMLRRDRVRAVVWIVILLSFSIGIPLVFEGVFGTELDRIAMAETMKNPAMTAIFGPGYGIDNYTTGSMMAHEMLLFTMIPVAIMNILMVNRHTRKDEEMGRLEVIRSLPVGRLSNLSAALLEALFINAALALLTGIGMAALGIESMGLQGSMLYGAVLGVTGLFFAAATAAFAQLSASSRTVTGLSFGFFGAAYMLRAAGDMGMEPLSLISPLGLPLRAQVYVKNLWWPILVILAASAAAAAIAFYLNARRDLDAGILPQRKGRAEAQESLLSPMGLALRLTRGMILAWAIGMLVFGAMYGSVFEDMDSFLQSNEFISQMFVSADFSFAEQFMSVLMKILTMASVIPALMLAQRLHGEEKRGRTEHLAARAVSRWQMMGVYAALSLLSCALMTLCAVLGLWGSAYAVMAQPISFTTMMISGFANLPAMLVMCGLALALIGWFPSASAVVWAYLGYAFFTDYIGMILRLPEWTGALSPFAYVANYPVEQLSALPLIVLTVIAAVLTAAGFVGYRRRDLAG